MYEYRAEVIRVVDGDTVDVEVDLGFRIGQQMRLRLVGINAPELHTLDGPPARDHLAGLVGILPVRLTIRTVKDRTEKYGRYLASLIRDDGIDVNASMMADGFAVAYNP